MKRHVNHQPTETCKYRNTDNLKLAAIIATSLPVWTNFLVTERQIVRMLSDLYSFQRVLQQKEQFFQSLRVC
jgi:ABC-type glycerol-3-phosphate transport system permease component